MSAVPDRPRDDWWECKCGFLNPPDFDDCLRCGGAAPGDDDPEPPASFPTPGYVSPDEYEANMEYYDHQHCLLYP